MSDRQRDDGGTRLSPQTLIVASLASLTAAIVTSTFWQRGTPITAAITPVIVALASELYSRPARRITQLSSRAGAVRTRRFSEEVERERVSSGGPRLPDRRPEPLRPPDEKDLGPVRIYRTEQRSSPVRRVHIRVALVTAAIAFAIAAAALTLPELLFGGSVASHGKTTLFGGGHRHKSTSHQDKSNGSSTQTSPTTSAPSPSTTAPAPSTTTPSTTPTPTVPQTTTPSQTPAPQGTTAPAPTPPSG